MAWIADYHGQILHQQIRGGGRVIGWLLSHHSVLLSRPLTPRAACAGELGCDVTKLLTVGT